MGGKKIAGAVDAPKVIVSSAPSSSGVERFASGVSSSSGGTSKCGYAGVLKKGLGNGKSSKPSPEGIIITESATDTSVVKANGNGTSHDIIAPPIQESLDDLTLQSVEQAGITHLAQEGDVFAASVEEAVIDTGRNNKSGVGSPDLLLGSNGSSDQWKMEYKPPDARYEIQQFRPPSLILPDTANSSVDSDYRAPPTLHLPASLVISPHDNSKQILLDPNAREFTPSPSPCPSPVLPPSVIGLVPSPYHMEHPPHLGYAPGVELGPVMYSSDYNGGPVMPLYGNGAPLGYGPIPGSPTPAPWEQNKHLGLGGEIGGPPSHMIRPYVSAPSMHGFIPSGCSPSIGAPLTVNMPGFSVPPAVTGREHVSRALLLSGVPTELSDHQLKHELEQWGVVRALGLERRHEGLVTVNYYDLRHAKEALRDVQQQHLLQQQRMQLKFHQMQNQRSLHNELDSEKQHDSLNKDDNCNTPARGLIGGQAVWAQYTVAVGSAAGFDSLNQGTLVVFNLDADMTTDELRAVFEALGAVKELRETPSKYQHKFVEFFDVRDAARALAALDGHDVGGKRVKIEFSRPGGQARKAQAQAQAQVLSQQSGSLIPPGSNTHIWLEGLGWRDPPMGPSQSMSPLQVPPPAYLWTNIGHVPAGPPLAPLSAFVQQQQWNVGHGQMQLMSYPQMQGPSTTGLTISGVSMLSEAHNRHYGRGGRGSFNAGALSSAGASNFHSGGGISGFSRGSQSGGSGASAGRGLCDEPTGRRRRGGVGVNGSLAKMELSSTPSSSSSSDPKPGPEIPSGGSRDSPRSGKTGLTPKSSPREHAQYTFIPEPAEHTIVTRTTLMIKNIPNKYNQSMLLALLDQHCLCCNNSIQDPNEPQSAYDFVYLPIDFKNRCNLGYAFVNFTSVAATFKLYKAFHSQQWEAFNSRKICEVSYARVQGRSALEEHFRNSRFACDTDEYLPLIFSPPRTGIVCPPPIVAAGHLAGRSVTCSPRAENCRLTRTRDLDNPVDVSQRGLSSGNSVQDCEAVVSSTGTGAAGQASHAGRRPNGHHR